MAGKHEVREEEEYIVVDGHRIRRTKPAEAEEAETGAPAEEHTHTGAPGPEPGNANSRIRLVVGVVSGKGGVGKSFVTALTAAMLRRKGHKVAILDADITGPSIPKMFGINRGGGADAASETEILPGETQTGIRLMSLNLLMPNETDPVIWRGPVIAGVVKQFWNDVRWGDIDVMLVDMPPGTGDVPLTVFQSLPVDGIVVVTTPQELVSMIVEKAINMADMMSIPVIGLVENMSYIRCPHCNELIWPFGEREHDAGAIRRGIDVAGRLPMDPAFAACADAGEMEKAETEDLDPLIAKIEGLLAQKKSEAAD
ncbi:MAG: Mrp/NBP35 family ATP-binding protein [Lachnospiraceae bacterium]|nr:Mrp/NBP35 family ATP-binding protein [Lachnospiraceae bacterium]